GLWTGLGADPGQLASGEVERLVPGHGLSAHERSRQPVRVVLQRQEVVGAPAEESVRDRVRRVASQLHHAAVLHVGYDRAGVGTVAVAHRSADLAHGSRSLTAGAVSFPVASAARRTLAPLAPRPAAPRESSPPGGGGWKRSPSSRHVLPARTEL